MSVLWAAVIASFIFTALGIIGRNYLWILVGWICWAPLALGLVTTTGFHGAPFMLVFHPVAALGLWMDRRWISWGALASPVAFMLQIGILVLRAR